MEKMCRAAELVIMMKIKLNEYVFKCSPEKDCLRRWCHLKQDDDQQDDQFTSIFEEIEHT